MSKDKPLITVMTASWDREKYLKVLINSLKNQTYKNFEWIIGSDGSIDNTDKLIRSLSKKVKFKITYIRSSLRIGKTSMVNLLSDKISGEYLIECDSDDYFLPDAFKNLLDEIKKNKLNENKNFIGVLAQNVDTNGVSQTFKKNVPKKTELVKWEDLLKKHDGDGTILTRSKNFKKKKYLEVDFLISESSLLNKVYKNKTFLLTPKIVKVMDRRTNNSTTFSNKIQYTRGWAYCMAINETLNVFTKKKFMSKIFIIINYWRYTLHGDINFYKALKMFKPIKKNFFYTLLFPISYVISLRDLFLKKVYKTHIEFNKNKKNTKINIEFIN